LKTIDADWTSGNFKQAGHDGAVLGHDALGFSEEEAILNFLPGILPVNLPILGADRDTL